MMIMSWPQAFAHIDCDAFYASCEKLRHPEWKDVPVCVLSSQDANIVAKCYLAKKHGITTGMPVWEARKILPDAQYVSADFAWYGVISDKVFAILHRFSPEVEPYSIDEGFANFNGLRSLWRKNYSQIADMIREAVWQEVGITVSVGVSLTRTLAKIASDFNKPNGTTVVSGRRIQDFLERVDIKDIPGIGGNRETLLRQFKIHTAADYSAASPVLIKRLLGKVGTDLWHELKGQPVYGLELSPPLPKTIAKTASMGQVTEDYAVLEAYLTQHATRLALELVRKRYLVGRLVVFIRQKDFDSAGIEIRLTPTDNYFTISASVQDALKHLYRPGVLYRGCGVIASDISNRESRTFDLFGQVEADEAQGKVLEMVDLINRKYGRDTMTMAAGLIAKAKARASRFAYPMIEAS